MKIKNVIIAAFIVMFAAFSIGCSPKLNNNPPPREPEKKTLMPKIWLQENFKYFARDTIKSSIAFFVDADSLDLRGGQVVDFNNGIVEQGDTVYTVYRYNRGNLAEIEDKFGKPIKPTDFKTHIGGVKIYFPDPGCTIYFMLINDGSFVVKGGSQKMLWYLTKKTIQIKAKKEAPPTTE